MDIQEYVDSFAQNLQKSANARTVYGDPVAVDGRTVIPVAKVRYGFGSGFGTASRDGQGDQGGGGGGGMRAMPIGVVEIERDSTRFIAFSDKRRLFAAAAAGFVAGFLLARQL